MIASPESVDEYTGVVTELRDGLIIGVCLKAPITHLFNGIIMTFDEWGMACRVATSIGTVRTHE